MISQLHKKHLTTAQKSTVRTAIRRRVRQTLFALALVPATFAAVQAVEGRPVKSGAATSTQRTSALQWRASPTLAETTEPKVATTVTGLSSQPTTIVPSVPPPIDPIQRVAFQQPARDNPQVDPFNDLFGIGTTTQAQIPPKNIPVPNIPVPNIPAQNIPAQNIPAQNIPAQNIPAQNIPAPNIPAPNLRIPSPPSSVLPPASAGSGSAIPSLPTTPGGLSLPPSTSKTPTIPNDVVPGNPLPPSLPSERLAPPVTEVAPVRPQLETPAQPKPLNPFDSREPSPSDQRSTDESIRNPFRRNRESVPSTDKAPKAKDAVDEPLDSEAPQVTQPSLRKKTALSCDDVRASVKSRTIDKISLDISPPFRPDIIDNKRLEKLRTDFLKNQKTRQWRDIQGRPLVEGSLQDLEFEQAVIKQSGGRLDRISLSVLSEPDLAYLSEAWGLPRQCRLAPDPYMGRSFTPSTLVWKASGLCHNPLYFEEVQLERYGHTTGPILQPVISSAHFFANIAVLPYKMGIHPLCECQYALGYYRPGNCAPWMIPPVPLSLRGAIAETAVVVGGVALIP